MINRNLSWHSHVDCICYKASTRIYFLILLKRAGISRADIVQVYCSIVRSVLEYACEVWQPGLTTVMNDSIERIQKRALSIICPDCCYEEALGVAKLDRLNIRRNSRCKRFFQTMRASSHKLNYLLPPKREDLGLRQQTRYMLPKVKTKRFKQLPVNYALFNLQ